jgi:hypothetical protein
MIMSVEQSVEWVAGETEVLEENLPQFHYIHHMSYTTCELSSNPGLCRWKQATNRLNYSTA